MRISNKFPGNAAAAAIGNTTFRTFEVEKSYERKKSKGQNFFDTITQALEEQGHISF